MYKKSFISKKNLIILTVSKVFIIFFSIYLLFNVSGKNLGFFSKLENLIIILSKDIIYLFYSIYSFYNVFSLVIIFIIFYYRKDIYNFLCHIKKKTFIIKNLYPIIGIILFIGTINSGGYPFSLVEIHGRTTLLFSYFYIIFFIYIYLNSINKKKLFLIHYIIFISAYLSSSYNFVSVKQNQEFALNKIKEFIVENKTENLIIYKSAKKTMLFESDLNNYFKKKLILKGNNNYSIYVVNEKERCFTISNGKFYLYLINNPIKTFLYEKKILREILTLDIDENKNLSLITEDKFETIDTLNTCESNENIPN